MYRTFEAELFTNSAGTACLNLTAEQLVDYANISMIIIVKGRLKNSVADREIYKGTINICNLANGAIGNFFSKIMSEGLINFSNFVASCPQPKNTYVVRNFPLDIDSYIPSVFLNLIRSHLEVTVSSRGKVTKNTPMIPIFSLKFFGIIV